MDQFRPVLIFRGWTKSSTFHPGALMPVPGSWQTTTWELDWLLCYFAHCRGISDMEVESMTRCGEWLKNKHDVSSWSVNNGPHGNKVDDASENILIHAHWCPRNTLRIHIKN